MIAHDHLLIREGVRLLLQDESWDVRGRSATWRGAADEWVQQSPDVILLALHILQENAAAAVRHIKKKVPNAELVILSSEADARLVKQLFEAGIKGFIGKEDSTEELMAAIRSAARHKPFFTSATSEMLFSKFARNGYCAAQAKLSPRQHQILALVADGRTNKEIAASLGISTRTAETHRALIMRRLNVSSTAELVRFAIRNRIIKP